MSDLSEKLDYDAVLKQFEKDQRRVLRHKLAFFSADNCDIRKQFEGDSINEETVLHNVFMTRSIISDLIALLNVYEEPRRSQIRELILRSVDERIKQNDEFWAKQLANNPPDC